MDAGPLAGLSILIVEDEFLIAMDVEQICLDSGAAATMIVASPEQMAEGLLDSRRFDAAVLDLRIAGCSTLPIAEALHARAIPFIFATGLADPGEIGRRFAHVAIVGKPYSSAELVATLAAALGAGRRSGDDR